MQILGSTVKASVMYRTQKLRKFVELVEQIKFVLGSINKSLYILDISSQINYSGLKAVRIFVFRPSTHVQVASVLCGDLSKAYETAIDLLNKLKKLSPPTAFFTLPGYTALPEVFLLLIQVLYHLELLLTDCSGTRNRLRSSAFGRNQNP